MKKIIILQILLICFYTKVNAQPYTITTIAGIGNFIQGYNGDGIPATTAKLQAPREVEVDAQGNVYIADTHNHRIRKINTNGIITTIAGNGIAGYSGDGGQATAAQLNAPFGLALDAAGNIFIADHSNARIRKIDLNGDITTIAGSGTAGFGGDGGQATLAMFDHPYDVDVDANGNIYVADNWNQRIRKIDVSGIITSIAGTGVAGFSGDGGQANLAKLNYPWGVTVDPTGNIFVVDNTNARIRKINPTGIITTVAGNGGGGSSGDGGPATSAQIGYPAAVIVDSAGCLYIADPNNNRVRKVDAGGTINTAAGTGILGWSGDGGLSALAKINSPRGLAIDKIGNVYIADSYNHCIRKLSLPCPSFNISASSGAICVGNTFVMNVSGANTYSINGVASNTFTFNPVNTTTYAITGTSLSCISSNTVIATVSVIGAFSLTASSGSLCSGNIYTIGVSGASSYSIDGTATNIFTVSPTNTSTYGITGEILGCAASNTAIATITVANSPTINVSGNVISCYGERISLLADGANTYTWSTSLIGPTFIATPLSTTSYSVNGTDSNGCVGRTTVTVTVIQCSGTTELQSVYEELKLYPNPNNGIFSVETNEKTKIIIIDALGRTVYSENTKGLKTNISIFNLSSGIYFLRADNKENQRPIKIIKE